MNIQPQLHELTLWNPKFFVWVCWITLVLSPSLSLADSPWTALRDGLEVSVRTLPKSEESRRLVVHALRVDLTKSSLQLLRPKKGRVDYVSAMRADSGAEAAINGSFFLEDQTPLGLLISEGVESNPLRKVDWGVFSIGSSGEASLVHTRDWKSSKGVQFAIQAGPRLVVNGKPLTFRDSMARRSALCLINSKTLIIVATENAVFMKDMADFLARSTSRGGMGCRYALNLDGGSSTHFVVPGKAHKVGVRGFDTVPVAIGVFPR